MKIKDLILLAEQPLPAQLANYIAANPVLLDAEAETITREDFLRFRGGGNVTWREFAKVKERYLAEKKQETKSTWGGARHNAGGKREGAGRKPEFTDGTKKTRRGIFRFGEYVHEILSQVANKNCFIETAVVEKWEREKGENA